MTGPHEGGDADLQRKRAVRGSLRACGAAGQRLPRGVLLRRLRRRASVRPQGHGHGLRGAVICEFGVQQFMMDVPASWRTWSGAAASLAAAGVGARKNIDMAIDMASFVLWVQRVPRPHVHGSCIFEPRQ